jgi:hypothetical protein
VSVGGLLALDQVLRKHWSSLTTLFWTLTGWSKMERLGRDDIAGSHLICGPNKGFTRVFVLGFIGCRPMGLSMIRLFCK